MSFGLKQQAKDLRTPLLKAGCQLRAAGDCGSCIIQGAGKTLYLYWAVKQVACHQRHIWHQSKSVCSDFKGMIVYSAAKKDEDIKNHFIFSFLTKTTYVISDI